VRVAYLGVHLAIRAASYAPCAMRYALCDLRYVVCAMCYALWDKRYTLGDMCYELCAMRSAGYCVVSPALCIAHRARAGGVFRRLSIVKVGVVNCVLRV
jgi:hypothetical protein